MRTNSILIILLVSCSLLIDCGEKDCSKILMVQIQEVLIPENVTYPNHAQINVKASATDGCFSDLFVVMKEKGSFNYYLKAYGTYTCCYDACPCPAEMVYHDTIIDFLPIQKGTYFFHVTQFKDRVDVDTMIVN